MLETSILRLTFLLLFLCLPAQALTPTQESVPLNKDLRHELIEMEKQDQLHREEMVKLMEKLSGPDKQATTAKYVEVVKKQDAIDQVNIKRLEEIVARYGWPTISLVGKEANIAAFLILQHAELSFQKKYFPLLKEAASMNEARPADVAMLEDRILMREGKKQIYGSQIRTNEVTNQLELYPIEDEENVDARRASVGLPPLAEYLKHFGLEYKPTKKK